MEDPAPGLDHGEGGGMMLPRWLLRQIKSLTARVYDGRAPDFIIGGSDNPYLRRWWLIPRNRFFNIYLHQFLRSDDDRALHDHPWVNCSILLSGEYTEVLPTKGGTTTSRVLTAGSMAFRWPSQAHRVHLHAGPCWTLFITGPRVRQWGFWCPKGWVHWQDFTAGPRGEIVGRGCE